MTVVSVAFDGTRISEAESATDGGTWDLWGGTKAPTQEVDWSYQLGASSAAMSDKVSSGTGGVDLDSTGATSYSTGPKAVIAWITMTTFGLMDDTVHGGMLYYIGSGPSDYYKYSIFGNKKAYTPAQGGWALVAIDPNEVAYISTTTGTPLVGSIDYYGMQGVTTGSVKSENVGHDSLCYLTYGDGLTLTGGTSTDPEGVFADFVAKDQGTVANRWGVVNEREGVLIVTGWLNIGSGAVTEFTDEGATIIWTATFTAEGFNGILFDLGTAATVISATDCTFKGRGTGFAKDFFDIDADVDKTNDVITLDTTKEWADLDLIVYSKEGGSEDINLTAGTNYWIAYDSTNSGWAVYASRDNAAADTSRIIFSTPLGPETHSFAKAVDTRPEMATTGSTGTSVTIDGSLIDHFSTVDHLVDTSAKNCKYTNCGQITCGTGADISGSTIKLYTGEADTAAIQWNVNLDPSGEMDDITITMNDTAHHAVEFGSSAPLTMNLSGWTTSGFSASNGNDDSTFLFADRGSDQTWTVNISGSTGNFSYKKARAGDTVTVNVAVSVTFDRMKDNTEVRVFKTSDDSVVDGIENATAGTADNRSFTWSAAATTDVYYRIINKTHEFIEVQGYIVPSNNTTVDIAQKFDSDFSDP